MDCEVAVRGLYYGQFGLTFYKHMPQPGDSLASVALL